MLKKLKIPLYFFLGFPLLFLNGLANAQSLEGIINGVIREVERSVNREQRPTNRNISSQRDEIRLSNKQREAVQFRLNELGYNVGAPDGDFGRRTRRGISEFQIDNGFAPTGYLTGAQYAAIIEATDGQSASFSDKSSLSKNEIFQLQEALNQLGYPVGNPDGIIGSGTANGLADYLRAKGLNPFAVKLRDAYELARGDADAKGTEDQPVVVSDQDPAPVQTVTAMDLEIVYQGDIVSKGIQRAGFDYGTFALQKQRFLKNRIDQDQYRNVMLNLAIALMNADINTSNELNEAKKEIEQDESRKPKRQRVQHLHHVVYLEDLLDSPHADDLAKTILQINYDVTFFANLVEIQNRPGVKNYIYLSFFDPSRIGDSDAKFYLARNIGKVEALVKLLVRNLPDEVYFNGNLEHISVDPFDMKIKLKRPNSFLEVWQWRNGGSSNKLPSYTTERQIYEVTYFREAPWPFGRENDDIYTYPIGAKVVTEGFERHGERSKRRIGAHILSNMRALNDLLGDTGDFFIITARDIDVTKANIPIEMLEIISKHLGTNVNLTRDLPYLAQARLLGMESVDGNESIAIELELESLVLWGNKDGKVVAELSPDVFPYFGGKVPAPRVRALDEADGEFSFRPRPEERGAALLAKKHLEQDQQVVETKSQTAVADRPVPDDSNESGPIGGYYYFVDDRSIYKNLLQLDRAQMCVPRNWKREPNMVDKGIRVGAHEYDQVDDGIERFKISWCQVLVLDARETKIADDLIKDYGLLVREPERVAEAEVLRLRDEKFKECTGNAFKREYYECSCLADEFAQRIRNQEYIPVGGGSYDLRFLEKGNTQCPNREAMLNKAEQICHQTQRDAPDVDVLCECLAKQIVAKFVELPRLSADFVSNITVETLNSKRARESCSP
ncbi:hypothetical protein CSC94_22195 [Zhengella mangrovi]|uniref:Peptidoglycan binding-like domain-containing protein n=1 Tax=Zhengella mangrovi TaxID=1982044 RepID=A0A2G1QH92_9HYPH|nr:peptidoglycan-binding protein [Zhengella mangrovi]PHP64895.1 hypothetical protein CSC94_22195 [Zhengella mangrovi]